LLNSDRVWLVIFGGAKGMHNWANEAIAFFSGVLTK
jgi:hypothetical protein